VKQLKLPNFFIIGAPKSGTTTLSLALAQHPQIFMPKARELHYFAPDLFPGRGISKSTYTRLFRDAAGYPAIGDKSVWYLYSAAAPDLILDTCPDARVLIMLRNPVEMLSSLHNQYLFSNRENHKIFYEALTAEVMRRQGKDVPATVENPWFLFYTEIGKYSKHVVRYLERFGKDKVKIVIFDDFIADPAGVYRSIFSFLGVDQDFQPVIETHNPRKTVRSRLVSKITNPPIAVKSFLRKILPFVIRRNLLKTVYRLNTRPIVVEEVESRARQWILDHVKEDVEHLQDHICRDLSLWLNPS